MVAVIVLPWALRAQIFRVTTTAVSVNVSVSRGNTPVLGLTAADFAVMDQGVRQTITSVSSGEVPIDVSLVVDVSGSTTGEIKKFQSSVTAMAAMLRPIDRVRLLSFSSEVRELSALSAASTLPAVEQLAAGSLSSIYDAIAVPLLSATPVGRRHLIVAFTDGIENRSVINGDQLVAIAQRSEAVLHVVSPGQLPSIDEPNEVPLNPARMDLSETITAIAPDQPRLKQVVEATGGSIHLGSTMVNDFRKILTEFTSACADVCPTGVPTTGWHPLSVRFFAAVAQRGAVTSPAPMAAVAVVSSRAHVNSGPRDAGGWRRCGQRWHDARYAARHALRRGAVHDP